MLNTSRGKPPMTTTALTLDQTDEVCALFRDTAFLNMRNGEPAGIPYLNTNGIVDVFSL